MTPEERFTKIENALYTVSEHLAHITVHQDRAAALQVDREERLGRLERGMSIVADSIDVLVGLNRRIADILDVQSLRLDRLEGEPGI